jgi:hypothetical protein
VRLIADGVTPNERLVLVNELVDDDSYAFVLDQPLFLWVGDRIAFEKNALVIAHADGRRSVRRGYWEPRCYAYRLR